MSDAPIRLQGKAIDHVFESPGEILSSIKNFYVNETLKQVYKIIGSLDFVGNPTIIFSSFVSGVRDLVVAPTTAFLKSPTNVNQVGIGVAKGTISLFSHSASGIFGFAAKMSATAGQAAAILSLDAEYREWHRDRIVSEATNLNRVWKRRGVQSVSEMLTRPVGDILLGIAMGASGLFISPYRGFRKNGKWGFVQGVASGTAGVVAKPLVGVLDAFTHFSATAHDIAKSVNVLERRYQPAFKLRLPYAFGPMNILSPFDPVTARSMYLLKIFPPKSKRNHRRNERAREIHVHSEVLHMEPGVETYAIATTIRVVLLKLKKDANGTLSPSFAWEVDLTGDASVSSRVSDHGHNGVALTITKHGKDGKKGDTTKAVKSKGGRGAPLVQETVQETHLSSALSVDSEFSDLDSDFEARLDDPVGDDLQQGRVTFEEPLSENDIETSYHEHGAMKRGGEVSEWFTVLAEYQHRRQLTILHNAISCIVGDFNAVIVGGRHELDHGSEGVTDFGIFGFDANLQGGKAAYASNAVLVNALENLPWIHENVFKKVNGKSRSRQRDFVSTLRQNWVFSSELEASMAQGGPSWLIEARARAMFVSSEAPPVPEFVDPDDPVVKKLLLELEQGHISFEQAAELLHSSNEDSFSSEEDVDIPEAAEIRLRDNVEAQRHTENADDLVLTSLEMPKNEGDGVLDNRDLSGDRDASQIRDVGSAAREDAAAGVFHSIEFQYPISGLGGDAKKSASGPEHIERLSVPADNASMSGNDFVDFKSPLNDLEEQDAAVGDSTVKTGSPFSSPNLPTKETVQTRSNQFVEKPQPSPARDTRMDRMETLLEQLVIINAQQVQKSIVPTDVISDNNSTATSNIADTLKHELADLRAQVLARAKEDDALRGEIHALRRQLAKRRDEDLSQKSSRPANKGIKLPEILRFGHSGKKNERESDQSPTKDVSRRQESKPESVEAVSPDVGRINERGGSGQKMSRRLSGGSIDQGFGRMNRQGSASGQRMPRRLSNDLVELEVDQGSGRMNRRGSASGQRMPRQLSNDSEKLEVIVLDREGTGSGRAMPRRPSNDSMNLGVG